MPNFNESLSTLDQYYESIADLKEFLQKQMNSNSIPKPKKDEIQATIERQVEDIERFRREALEELVNFPPHKAAHFAKLPEFQNFGTYDKSVFIMTKFPREVDLQPEDHALNKVIQAVRDAITENAFTPRIALDRRFHQGLWDNVEMYLLGCRRGVAIIESIYQQELNPNVTMEWGWMRGMNRDVLYLVENTFDLGRADISGLIQDRFAWDDPETGIKRAVRNWLQGS